MSGTKGFVEITITTDDGITSSSRRLRHYDNGDDVGHTGRVLGAILEDDLQTLAEAIDWMSLCKINWPPRSAALISAAQALIESRQAVG